MRKTLEKIIYGIALAGSLFFGAPNVAGGEENKTSKVGLQSVVAGEPYVEWEKTFGGDKNDYASSVQQTTDGGYIIAGWANGIFPYPYDIRTSEADAYLLKIDSNGNKLWDKIFGGTKFDIASSVQQTTDGGYIIAGETYSFGESSDIYVVKTDSNGNKQWEKTFGGTKEDYAQSVQQTFDGGYIIAGDSNSFVDPYPVDGYPNIYLIKTDSSGNKQWENTFGVKGVRDCAYSVQQTKDNGYIITGFTNSWGVNFGRYADIYLIKTDPNGNKQWDRLFGSGIAQSVQQTNDEGYIVAGIISTSEKSGEFYLIKTDSNGDKQWERTFGGGDKEWAYSVQQTTDGGYIIAGETYSFGESSDIYVVKTDSNGNKQWEKNVGGSGSESGRCIEQTIDGGYIIAGYANSDIYLLKLSGEPPQQEPIDFPTIPTPTPTPGPTPVIPTPTPVPERKNLVMVTHGWEPFGLGSENWLYKMTDDIYSRVNNSWSVFYYDWEKDAKDLADAKAKAKDHGKLMGQYINNNFNLNYAHLIGHSAGAWLINETAKEIRNSEKNKDAEIHLTFLDAYIPFNWDVNEIGGVADWADNYYVKNDIPFTETNLKYAHNVDISQLIDINLGPLNHGFPHEWYEDTITSPTTFNYGDKYGFVRSLEGGGEEEWEKSLLLPKGHNAIPLTREQIGLYDIVKNILARSREGNITSSLDGLLLDSIQPNLSLASDTQTSPTTKSVWLESRLDVPQDSNYVNFNYQFHGESNGYISVYLNDNLILIADQRIHENVLENSEDIYIGNLLTAQDNILSMRLDAVDENSTGTLKAFVSNVEYGKISEKKNSATRWNIYE